MNGRLLGKLGGQSGRRIGTRQFKVACTVASRFTLDLDFATGQLRQGLGQQVFFRQSEIQQDFRRQGSHLATL
ncbi:hypothetical protein D3C80_1462240 [compost metagenome]